MKFHRRINVKQEIFSSADYEYFLCPFNGTYNDETEGKYGAYVAQEGLQSFYI